MINPLCDLSLMAAYTHETHIITKKIVDMAFAEMEDKSWVVPRRGWGFKS